MSLFLDRAIREACDCGNALLCASTGTGDHRNRLLVVTGQYSSYLRAPGRMELDSFTDAEIQHGAVRAHLIEESESSHNLVIQLDEFFFGKRINIDAVHWGAAQWMFILHRKLAFGNLSNAGLRRGLSFCPVAKRSVLVCPQGIIEKEQRREPKRNHLLRPRIAGRWLPCQGARFFRLHRS